MATGWQHCRSHWWTWAICTCWTSASIGFRSCRWLIHSPLVSSSVRNPIGTCWLSNTTGRNAASRRSSIGRYHPEMFSRHSVCSSWLSAPFHRNGERLFQHTGASRTDWSTLWLCTYRQSLQALPTRLVAQFHRCALCRSHYLGGFETLEYSTVEVKEIHTRVPFYGRVCSLRCGEELLQHHQHFIQGLTVY